MKGDENTFLCELKNLMDKYGVEIENDAQHNGPDANFGDDYTFTNHGGGIYVGIDEVMEETN